MPAPPHAAVPLFSALLGPPSSGAAVRARVLWLLPLALALHLLALGAALRHAPVAAAAGAGEGPPALVVHLLAPRLPPGAPVAGPASAAPPAARPRSLARRRAVRPQALAQQAAPVAEPTPQLEAPPSPVLDPGAGVAAVAAGSGSARFARGVGAPGGSGQGPPGAGGEAARLTPEEEAQSLEEYVRHLYRSRFRRVRYPHLAAAAGITGLVNVRVRVGPFGELLGMERIGRCPHPVLCEGAEEAVRRADPFPPPPTELGSPLTLELPFRYFLR